MRRLVYKLRKRLEYYWFRIYSRPTNRSWIIPWYIPTILSISAVIVALLSHIYLLSSIELSILAIVADGLYIIEKAIISAERKYIRTKDLIIQVVGGVEEFDILIQKLKNKEEPEYDRAKRQIAVVEQLVRGVKIGEISGHKPRATPYNDSAETACGILLRSIRGVKQIINQLETVEPNSKEQEKALEEAEKQRDIFADNAMNCVDEIIDSVPGMWNEDMNSVTNLKKILS